MKQVKRSSFARYFVAGCLGALISSTSLAATATRLIVVRATGGSLWTATCVANTCGAFTSITGNFASQPTLSWDDAINGYVLIGTASNGTIWQATFTQNGVFNNDWTQLPGGTTSPAAVATRTFHDNSSSYGSVGGNVVLTSVASYTPQNLKTITNIDAGSGNGWYQCTATASVSIYRANTSGSSLVWYGLTDTSATFMSAQRYGSVELPPGTPAGTTTIPIAITSWFDRTVSPVYFIAEWAGTNTGATITVNQPTMVCSWNNY